MTEIATEGGESKLSKDQAGQLMGIVNQMTPEAREELGRLLGVKPVRQKKSRITNNEDIKRQSLMGGEVSHGEDFQPAFSESVTQAMIEYPKLKALVIERWEDGQPISHANLEFDDEIKELIIKEKKDDSGEESQDLMQRMGQDYVSATSGEEDLGKGLATLAKEEFSTTSLEDVEV